MSVCSADSMNFKPPRETFWVSHLLISSNVMLISALHSALPERTKQVQAQSGSVFHSVLFDFSLGNKPPAQHGIDESVVFETVVNKLWLTRLPVSFPQILQGSTTGGHVYCSSDVDKSLSHRPPKTPQRLSPSPNLTVFGTKGLKARKQYCSTDCCQWAPYRF